jgi:hypothetical protein
LDTFFESLKKSNCRLTPLILMNEAVKIVFVKVALCDLGRLRAASFFAKSASASS